MLCMSAEAFCGGKFGAFWGPATCYFLSTLPGIATSIVTGIPVGGVPCICHTGTRSFIRNKFGIAGDPFGDFILTWCCPLCALCQESREIIIRMKMNKTGQVKPLMEGTEHPGAKDAAALGVPVSALPPRAVPPQAYPPPASVMEK
ncbi:hypothetical protein HYH03_009613 [Edaphochlamys debaryana]|uniref:Uncharacterized protein n=1 Tax=Edaphochlamys debaryana TaxID=47281 RepID=A0A835XVY0_9CHLO|nr:hypothetical protein HYH03_009613 [Edaphochlamys debaryana]|eukprot:KAG2492122.1 hypothetical protein HYH03_009613 [Edaphochlamys debaryana]